jgi:hypothetical protein
VQGKPSRIQPVPSGKPLQKNNNRSVQYTPSCLSICR